MRVVQVSAHFPPNFVSGGTLVPQRIARAVAEAGHESFVYAGYLDATREPLETWTEQSDGVTVRWVVSTPWTGWADPRNSLNPDVEADFRAWLTQVRPDVVHLHSLQALGASLVQAAKDAGAVVVVTMHDFWWFCARQFLVSRDMRPCSLVVDCGTCPCEVDHDWLEQRNAAMAPYLAAADVVLAPSASAARVFAANGVPADRLRVDENGLPGTPSGSPTEGAGSSSAARDDERGRSTSSARPFVPHSAPEGAEAEGSSAPEGAEAEGSSAPEADHAAPLRLMFAGGSDPMKGLDVLTEAVRTLTDLPGWSLDLYGAPHADLDGLPVRALPAYAPADLPAVLAAHDVLVLPSVMRESHSILTREALSAGLAVVCSDTLGPEEAVEHGRNGLVVPAGDAGALAASLRQLISDPAAARAMMHQPATAPVRPFADQAAGLLALYRELTTSHTPPEQAETPAAEAAAGLMHRVLFLVGIQGAPQRYRVHLPAEALRMQGVQTEVRHYRDPELTRLVEEVDAVVIYRVPATHQVLDLIARVRRRRRSVPVLFDVDDLIFDPDLKNEVHGLGGLDQAALDLWWRGVARYRTTMEAADMFIGSTAELCRHATAVTGLPARRFANGVGALLAQASDRALQRPRTPGPLRIGYFSGTDTHDADWAAVEPAVIRIMQDRPDVELWLGGLLEPTAALGPLMDRVKRLPFVAWYELPGLLRDVDVALAPLTEASRFNEAKSAIKWLEAALVETPVIASPTEPFREAVDHGRTGYLATTHHDWVAAMGALLDDVATRRRVGSQARREVLLRWSPHVQGPVYLENLIAAAEHVRAHGPRRPGNWEPVLDDEPLAAAEAYVEPYAVPGRRLPGTLLRHPAVRKAAAARRVYRQAGARAVAERALRLLR